MAPGRKPRRWVFAPTCPPCEVFGWPWEHSTRNPVKFLPGPPLPLPRAHSGPGRPAVPSRCPPSHYPQTHAAELPLKREVKRTANLGFVPPSRVDGVSFSPFFNSSIFRPSRPPCWGIFSLGSSVFAPSLLWLFRRHPLSPQTHIKRYVGPSPSPNFSLPAHRLSGKPGPPRRSRWTVKGGKLLELKKTTINTIGFGPLRFPFPSSPPEVTLPVGFREVGTAPGKLGHRPRAALVPGVGGRGPGRNMTPNSVGKTPMGPPPQATPHRACARHRPPRLFPDPPIAAATLSPKKCHGQREAVRDSLLLKETTPRMGGPSFETPVRLGESLPRRGLLEVGHLKATLAGKCPPRHVNPRPGVALVEVSPPHRV